MRRDSFGRVLRLGGCGLVAAGLVTVGLGTPAFASDGLWIHSAPYQLVLPAATDSAAAPTRTAGAGLYHDNADETVTGGVLTVDVSGLAGVATVTWPDNCTATGGATATCDVGDVPTEIVDQVQLKLRAADGAQAGAHGTITYHGTAGSLTAEDETQDVTVATGPDLTFGDVGPIGHVKPGSRVDVPLRFDNNGNEAADGAILTVVGSAGLRFAEQYSNCAYTDYPDDGDYPASYHAVCTFDQPIDAYSGYAPTDPLALGVAADALSERVDMKIEPKSDAALAAARRGLTLTKGDAAPLTLEKVARMRPAASDGEINDEDNYVVFPVDADSSADFSVTGAQVKGKAGDSVTATVGVRNNGPAWVGNLGSGDPVATVDFRVPASTTATGIPDACSPRGLDDEYIEQREGAPRYLCDTKYWLNDGATVSFPFTLHIDKVVPGASGSASFLTRGFLGQPLPFDPNGANNTAYVTVNADAHAAVPDFNGDGYGDVAVTAPGASVGGAAAAGAVVVHYGSASGVTATKRVVLTQNSTGVPGTAEAGDRFGSDLAFGDFNKDGYTDIAVSASYEKVGTDVDGGTVEILWGSSKGLNGGTTVPDPSPSGHDRFGQSVEAADFDGDGKTDLAIGSSSATVNVYRGGFTPSGATGGTDSYAAPIQSGGDTGVLNLVSGDVNGDGVADLITNGYEKTTAGWDTNVVAFGAKSGGLPSSGGKQLPGGFLSAVGDLNSDGYGDIVIGEDFDPEPDGAPSIPGAVTGGKVVVVDGAATGVGSSYSIDQDSPDVPGVSETGDHFGGDLSIGDVNGDGHPDLAVGAWGESVGSATKTGSVTMLYGTAKGLTGSGAQYFTQDSAGVPGSNETGDEFGSDVKLTDVNGDGKADLTIGGCGENGFNGSLVALRSNGTGLTTTGAVGVSATAAGLSTAGEPLYGLSFAD
jgi:FG-GAP-like repeat/FG-GAP repeat